MGEFSFKVPEDTTVRDFARNGNNRARLKDLELSESEKRLVKDALENLAGTPSGRKLLSEAANNENGGKIHIIDGTPLGIATATIPRENTIIFNYDSGAPLRYMGIDGNYQDLTMERALAHEFCHLTPNGATEAAAVVCENDAMEDFRGDVPRGRYTDTDRLGTPEFERIEPPLQKQSALPNGDSPINLAEAGFSKGDQSVRFTGDTSLLAEARQAGLDVPPHIAAQETTSYVNNTRTPVAHQM